MSQFDRQDISDRLRPGIDNRQTNDKWNKLASEVHHKMTDKNIDTNVTKYVEHIYPHLRRHYRHKYETNNKMVETTLTQM